MLKCEKIQLKEALIITYKTNTGFGKMSLKKNYENFEEQKHLVMTKLTQDGCEVTECKDVLYCTDEDLNEWLRK